MALQKITPLGFPRDISNKTQLPIGSSNNQRLYVYPPYRPKFGPTVLVLSTVSGVTIETSISSKAQITPNEASPPVDTAVWTTQTPTGNKLVINEPYSAIRITSANASAVDVEIMYA